MNNYSQQNLYSIPQGLHRIPKQLYTNVRYLCKKLYSLEHIAHIYNIEVEKLKEWSALKFKGDIQKELPPSMNSEIATFLGVQSISLNPNKARKTHKLLFQKYKTEIKNAKYRELIKPYVDELNDKTSNGNITNKIDQVYKSLPTKNQFLKERCEKKYFTAEQYPKEVMQNMLFKSK